MVSMVLRHRLAGVRNLRYSHVGPLVQESRRMGAGWTQEGRRKDAGKSQKGRRKGAEKMPESRRKAAGRAQEGRRKAGALTAENTLKLLLISTIPFKYHS